VHRLSEAGTVTKRLMEAKALKALTTGTVDSDGQGCPSGLREVTMTLQNEYRLADALSMMHSHFRSRLMNYSYQYRKPVK